jgi:hypothetical protein
MSPEIAPWKQRPKLATSVVKKAISCVLPTTHFHTPPTHYSSCHFLLRSRGTAPKQELPPEEEEAAAGASLEELPLDLNATAAAKWGISLVRALNLLGEAVEAGAGAEAEATVEAGTATLASRRPGMYTSFAGAKILNAELGPTFSATLAVV